MQRRSSRIGRELRNFPSFRTCPQFRFAFADRAGPQLIEGLSYTRNPPTIRNRLLVRRADARSRSRS